MAAELDGTSAVPPSYSITNTVLSQKDAVRSSSNSPSGSQSSQGPSPTQYIPPTGYMLVPIGGEPSQSNNAVSAISSQPRLTAQAVPDQRAYTAVSDASDMLVPTGKSEPVPHMLLRRKPAMVNCRMCGCNGLTRTEFVIGNTNHALATVFFFTTGVFFWIPYKIKSWRNINHQCGICGVLVATWHKSGRIDVFQ